MNNVNRINFILVNLLVLAWLSACEENTPLNNTSGSDGITYLPLYAYTWFNPANINIYITDDFTLESGKSVPPTEYSHLYEYDDAGGLFSSGLWIAGKIDGTVHANLTWYSKTNLSANHESTKTGLFVIDRTDLPVTAANWPKAYDAPVNEDNSVKIFGDQMCLSVLFSDTTSTDGVCSKPIPGLQILAHLIAYKTDRIYLQNDENMPYTLFFKYIINNAGTSDITDAYVGFWTDTDLEDCYAGCNATGYDTLREMSYTYTPDQVRTKSDPLTDSLYIVVTNRTHCVAGYTFVNGIEIDGIDFRASSHRIMLKNEDDQNYRESTLNSPERMYWTLQGLSNFGQSMLDPTTGTESKFAFTGDPVNKTGWLDDQVGRDVRSLISIGPFDLGVGESQTVCICYTMAFGDDLKEALTNLKQQIWYYKIRPAYWND